MKESNPDKFKMGNVDKVKYPEMDLKLLSVAEKMEVALLEFDGFHGKESYSYEDGTVTFNLTSLNEEELTLLTEKISSSAELTKNYTVKISDDNEESNTLLTIRKN